MLTPARAMVPLLVLACTPETELEPEPGPPPSSAAGTAGSAGTDAASPLAGQLVDPSPGATDIAPNLAELIVAFSEPVSPAGSEAPVMLHAADGTALPLSLGDRVPCDEVCYRVPLTAVLSPSTVHTVETVAGGLLFLDGKPLPGGTAGQFTTAAAEDSFAPRITEVAAVVTERCLSLHVQADELVYADLAVSGAGQVAGIARAGFAQTLDLTARLPDWAAGLSAQATVTVRDRAGNVSVAPPITVAVPPAMPPLVVIEVLANSAGSESTQEWVELFNPGAAEVSLAGLALADKSGSDLLPEASLAPGAFALVVGEKYDPAEGSDVPPGAGTLIVRVAGKLGADGLSNAGEPVRLLAPSGDVISQYGGWVDVSASAWSGKSVKRAAVDACDGASAWTSTPTAATPGW